MAPKSSSGSMPEIVILVTYYSDFYGYDKNHIIIWNIEGIRYQPLD
jgi:hypothetical protein